MASSYGDAELRIAPWLAQDRSQFYVATKTDARTAQEAKEDLHRFLERMGFDLSLTSVNTLPCSHGKLYQKLLALELTLVSFPL